MRETRFLVVLIVVFLLPIQKKVSAALKTDTKDKFVVVLDAGHGGHDPGNRGNGYKEKDIALKVVLAVGKLLEADGRFEVIYTRKSDKFVELFERGKIANKAKADLFVSIHCNSHRSQAYGTETFVLGLNANNKNFEVAKNENSVILLEDNYQANYDGFDPNAPESIIGLTLLQEEYLDQSLHLASVVEKEFTKNLKRKSRGVKQAGFIVLHQTYMPSVLIELGFLTNNREGKYLNSKIGQTNMANAITASIINYKDGLDESYVNEEIVVENAPDAQKKEVSPEVAKNDNKAELPSKELFFKVQIAASSQNLKLDASNFKGLTHLSKEKVGSVYKYYFGQTFSYQEACELQEEVKTKGYEASFVVAFKNNKPISLQEAIKDMKN
ncbi:N-acetylmuramoyl-L-alanine amidase [Aquimarina sp. ERC-38]|uniref:N-acetylmuramoyl-L-alanine amidase family protein n=1 Tax=Aquimarina sp. ERC-38 TaxID=2949996 RepID=UPI0022484A96|nr:N-acetylmuramoyl-L-alanine amidase [Aquimarina sp. ERC-38]UZO80299.1 N-acetylmuramoyl-L-alanine amidase [Aquimarina sp. ERC-38]